MRYKGPVHRVARSLHYSITETGKEFNKGKKRRTSPGQHGVLHTKLSDYGKQLKEKQKIKYMYGLTEKQTKNYFVKASNMKGSTAANFLHLLESRLDNLVFRMGFASTRKAARQLVTHGHILVDQKKLDIPSALVSLGQTISLIKAMQENKIILENFQKKEFYVGFVKVDKPTFSGQFASLPERGAIAPEIDELLIIEYYNR